MIYIDNETKLRVNIYYTYKGFSKLDTPEIRAKAGVVGVAEPTPPEDYSDDLYYRTEQDAEPYVVYTRKSDEQIKQIMQERANRESLAYLESTDWYVTRFAETAAPIPEKVVQARAEARKSIVHTESVWTLKYC